jgi:hypothetical protein
MDPFQELCEKEAAQYLTSDYLGSSLFVKAADLCNDVDAMDADSDDNELGPQPQWREMMCEWKYQGTQRILSSLIVEKVVPEACLLTYLQSSLSSQWSIIISFLVILLVFP